MDHDAKASAGGWLGTFVLSPAIACFVAGAITGETAFYAAGAALIAIFAGALLWLRPTGRVLSAALQISTLWLMLGSLGITVYWLFGGAPSP